MFVGFLNKYLLRRSSQAERGEKKGKGGRGKRGEGVKRGQ